MRLACHGGPIWKLIAKRIAVLEEAAEFHQEPARIRPRPPGHPTYRTRSGHLGEDLDCAPNVIALHVLGHQTIVDPAIAVTDDFVAAIHEGLGHRKILFECARHRQNADVNGKLPKQIKEPPNAAAAAKLEHRLNQWHPQSFI